MKGLEPLAKIGESFPQIATKKSHPPEKVTLASTKILNLHRLAPHFPGPELCICAASVPSEI
jgi:hypothetical protein